MPRPRTPPAKAKAIAADVKNPQRKRSAPKGIASLGGPPTWLTPWGRKAFEKFRAELPWLKESHRALVEIASILRADLLDPDAIVGLQRIQELRRCLAQLGATPADESKVTLPDGDDEDPEASFFRPPGAKPH